MTDSVRVYRAWALIQRRAAGVPDRTADSSTVNHAARVLRGVSR